MCWNYPKLGFLVKMVRFFTAAMDQCSISVTGSGVANVVRDDKKNIIFLAVVTCDTIVCVCTYVYVCTLYVCISISIY